MSHYKELNKELVEQVQTMKVQLSLYCNEIVCLKRDMMQEHESQVFLRKKCFNWAVENFKKLIETVEPECSLIEKLRDYNPQIEVLSSLNRNSDQKSNSLRSSNDDRRSSQLRLELQRSNNIIHSRKSMCCISPVRHSSASSVESEVETEILLDDEPSEEVEVESLKQGNADHIIFEESEDEVEEQDMELESDKESVQNERNIETNSNTLHHKNERIICEASEEEETDSADCSQYESVEEITIDISHAKTTVEEHNDDVEISIDISPTRTALSDLTNTHNSQKQLTQKRKFGGTVSRRILNRTQHLTSYEESQESRDFSMSDATQKNVAISRNYDKLRQTDVSPKNMEVDESIQKNREKVSIDKYHAARRKSIRMPEIITQDVSVATTSFAINDLTLQSFNAAVASSTPNSRNNSNRNVAEDTVSIDSSSLITSTNARPSRKCKPKVLVEPKLGSKMRNETNHTLTGKSRSKKKK